MSHQWESRERRIKRIALTISVLLHLLAITFIATGFGNDTVQKVIEQVFGSDEQVTHSETKV